MINKVCPETGPHGAHVWQYAESSDLEAFRALCPGVEYRETPTAPRARGGDGGGRFSFDDLDRRSLLGAARPVLEDFYSRQDALDRFLAAADGTRAPWRHLALVLPLATVADYRLLARRFSAADQAAWEDVADARRREVIFFGKTALADRLEAAALHARLDRARRAVAALAGLPYAPHCAGRETTEDGS